MLRQMGLKTSELRLEYETKVEELKFLPEILKKEGKSKEQAAKIMYTKRRELGRIYKEAAPRCSESIFMPQRRQNTAILWDRDLRHLQQGKALNKS